jgi:hypothetical protein
MAMTRSNFTRLDSVLLKGFYTSDLKELGNPSILKRNNYSCEVPGNDEDQKSD